MGFAEKIKALRLKTGLSQQRVATDLDMTIRTYGKYEQGQALPSAEQLPKISQYFGVSIDSLLTDREEQLALAYEKGGLKGFRDVQELIDEVGGVFAGGKLSDADKDAVMKALLDAYWIAREKNRKYAPKGYKEK